MADKQMMTMRLAVPGVKALSVSHSVHEVTREVVIAHASLMAHALSLTAANRLDGVYAFDGYAVDDEVTTNEQLIALPIGTLLVHEPSGDAYRVDETGTDWMKDDLPKTRPNLAYLTEGMSHGVTSEPVFPLTVAWKPEVL